MLSFAIFRDIFLMSFDLLLTLDYSRPWRTSPAVASGLLLTADMCTTRNSFDHLCLLASLPSITDHHPTAFLIMFLFVSRTVALHHPSTENGSYPPGFSSLKNHKNWCS